MAACTYRAGIAVTITRTGSTGHIALFHCDQCAGCALAEGCVLYGQGQGRPLVSAREEVQLQDVRQVLPLQLLGHRSQVRSSMCSQPYAVLLCSGESSCARFLLGGWDRQASTGLRR